MPHVHDSPPAPPADTGGLLLDLLRRGTHRLVRSVDAMTDTDWSAPSLLPHWNRSHVVAHLTLNAEALAAVLHGAAEERAVPMYPSQHVRDEEIDDLGRVAPGALRDRFLASTTTIEHALVELPPAARERTFDRVPGGRTVSVADVLPMRLREVEIHHADLGLAFSPADWPDDFTVHLIETMTARHSAAPSFRVHASDLDRTWACGPEESGPTVSGPAAALGWWLTGRGTGDGLTSNDGMLPRIESW